jgi:hypothetical protein
MCIIGLERNLSRPGEAIPADLSRAGKQPGRKFLKHRLHLHFAIPVNPAARFDVNFLAGRERGLKNIAERETVGKVERDP